MKCPKCGSTNVSISVFNEVKQKARHGFLWWIFIGWWWRILWFICFGMWYFLFLLVRGKKLVNVEKKVAVCQQCGKSWNMK